MNPIWTQIIIETTLRHKDKKYMPKKKYSNFELAKGYREFLIIMKRYTKDSGQSLIITTLKAKSALMVKKLSKTILKKEYLKKVKVP